MDTPNVPAGPTSVPPSGPSSGPTKPLFSTRRLLVIAVIGIVAGLGIYFAPRFLARDGAAPNYPTIRMGGTSTVFVVAENQWKRKYREEKGVELVYESTGTTVGVTHLLEGSSAIAFTHGALSAEQRQKAKEKGDVVHIPVLFFGVAPVYNIKELKGKDKDGKDKPPLNLTGDLLADIFMGKITKWNDPAIEKINPKLAPLPATPITVVHRKDRSGTTLVFTQYLDAATAATGAWRNKFGAPGNEVKWPDTPNFVAADRNLGVATKVSQTEGAIGYVDRMFTTYGDDIVLDYAAIENKDKSGFIRAEPANVTAAAAGLLPTLPEDLIFDLSNKSGKDAYPISGVIYAVCFQSQPAEAKQQVVDFLRWVTHEGQPQAAKFTYATLPPELVARIDQKLATIK